MKKYQVKINNMELEIIQDDDGKFITPYLCIEDWGKFGTALKPSFEPIIVARKPFKGSLIDNVIEYGVGGINIDECRVGETGGVKKINIEPNSGSKNSGFGCNGELEELNKGRFPANTIMTYDVDDYKEVCSGFKNKEEEYNARYFYNAKASKKDRDEGLDDFETKSTGELQGGRKEGSAGSIMQNANGGTRVNPYAGAEIPKKNTHPTVKPTELMQYLIRLVSPEGATILDPFNGSGSTGKAVMYENKERNKNYKYIGIELTEEYLPIAKARLDYVCRTPLEILKEQIEDIPEGQTSIFDFIGE